MDEKEDIILGHKEVSPRRLGFVISPSRSKLNQVSLKNFVSN
jgi:hypothetical protein